ncbi:16S rRNA (guanine(527)-N(7))-methyltransferase RsmG [Aphanothece hegewaldii CCALA 016]|uniref:Ribosomal RNA small subunit methyltransferase G n=1 Tax=Aphanothece hegewaldii CCALA 016 TaxID=2107694 RepID=A0A2T1M0H6_9CHRO|nr:16S rRNA (guanine(527)-N(7))-methyltransferase RsmG [Aphanothece hegewaldii]PSF38105.1 16S rRNA (guanine(527)-N(7))-methyltransferase RsmG [Aphanothece hegewaldii CCALA 016]
MNQSLPAFIELWQTTLNWQPNPEQLQTFQVLYDQILEGNTQLNLTRITEASDFWEKHLWDSLSGVSQINLDSLQNSCKVIDIGTGAGFPGIPIAISYPDWQVTLLDSTRKKLVFVQQILDKLLLKNAKILVGRAEAIAREKQYRSNYDLATIRAVSNASVCAEYALPFLKVGGTAILYRGQWSDEEDYNLKSALSLLGGEITLVKSFQTPLTQGIRHCVYVQKILKTPEEYPRAIGTPTQQPLGINFQDV